MSCVLPSALMERIQSVTPEHFAAILAGFSVERLGSFRINFLRSDAETVLEEFSRRNIVVSPFFAINGVYTFSRDQEYAIKGTDAFYQGKIYLQSLASLLPVLALDPQKGECILDMCAAPGGKTTQIALMQENQGRIIALEPQKIRYEKLGYNVRLQGAHSVEVIRADARHFLSETTQSFDRILLDAPCTSEGRIQMDRPKSWNFWKPEHITRNAALQRDLIGAAYQRLKAGGTLVYSTCTLAPEENEMVIADFLTAHPDMRIEPIGL